MIDSVDFADSVSSCDEDGYLDDGEVGRVTVAVMNGGFLPLVGATVTLTSATAGVTFPNGPAVAVPDLSALSGVTVAIDVALDASFTARSQVDLAVDLDAPGGCRSNSKVSLVLPVLVDEADSTVDDVEAVGSSWTLAGAGASTTWSRAEPTAGDHAWHGIDSEGESDTSLVSPPIEVGPDAFVVTFDERHHFEQSDGTNFDGAVIELSTTAGETWVDIETFGEASYEGVIGLANVPNALQGRSGYVGSNPSWPERDTRTIDLGRELAGKTVQLRFRIGTDQGIGDYGWEIDNISLSGVVNAPFRALVDDACDATEGPDDEGDDDGGDDPATTDTTNGPAADSDGGCDCRMGGTGADPGGALLAALAALGLSRRRRRVVDRWPPSRSNGP